MKANLLKEINRKAVQIIILFIILAYSFINPDYNKKVALLLLTAMLIASLILEYLRIEMGWKMPFISANIHPRDYSKMHSGVYFLISAVICFSIFDNRIAVASLLMAVFGDMMAAAVGKGYGTSLIYRNKTWAGFVAQLIVNTVVGFTVLAATYHIYIIVGVIIAATAAEILVQDTEENLIIPVFSGFVGQIIKLAF